MPGWKKLGATAGLAVLMTAGALWGLDALDRAFPPPIAADDAVSTELLDVDGQLLRAFATPEGRWRLKTTSADVDPRFVEMLIAYEDRRYYDHPGVDVFALARAALQFASNGRIVSGGSTLSMQVARLMEPRRERSFPAKFLQILRALQIERRLSKQQILDLYLTHAPYGGNLEGVRAASLAYFGKEPKRLTVAEAALLVALPQLPELRRPDRNPKAAQTARQRVLERMQAYGMMEAREVARAGTATVPKERLALPALAAHLAEAARRSDPQARIHHSTLRKSVQTELEAVARQAAVDLPARTSLAMLMADATTGEIIAEVGSADYFDAARYGWIDMTRAERSPGSTLKPFIYGLAFEQGLIAQETIIEDRPADFFGYRPRNFDMTYQGDVSIRQALQLSLNVPAVRLLDAVGAAELLSRLRRTGVRLALPTGEAPGLAIALGGAGVTLKDLVQAYAALANRGSPIRLGDGVRDTAETIIDGAPLMEPVAAWNVTDILRGVLPPLGSRPLGIAYKTGTSYGYRDAWSVGYDGRYVLGVWVGRPDNAAVPGITGYGSAAPILFQAFSKSGVGGTPLPSPPPGAERIAQADLPPALRRYSMGANGLLATSSREKAPRIVYPPEGAHVELGAGPDGKPLPLVVKLQAGRAPFRWLANGVPLGDRSRRRTAEWTPEGVGFSTLTVIDAAGRAASVGVFLH